MATDPSKSAPPKDAEKPKYATFEDLDEGAESTDELPEKDVTDVFGGKTIRIKALTAQKADAVSQASFKFGTGRGKGAQYAFSASSLAKFEAGVIAPKMTKDQVRSLYLKSGPSFQKVLKEIDELSNIDEESVEADEEAFPQ